MTARITDPRPVKWAKWGMAILGFLTALYFAGLATITTGVRWAAAPIVRDETRARQAGDSLIVARLEALDRKQDLLAYAFLLPAGSDQREAVLRRILRVEPVDRPLPPEVKVQE